MLERGAMSIPGLRRTPLPQAIAHRPFAVADARALGVPARRLRAKDLDAPLRGIRVPGFFRGSPDATYRALIDVLPPAAAFSHLTALRLWNVEIPWPHDADADIHVIVPESATDPQRAGIRTHTHRRPFLPLTELRGLPVVAPEHAWLLMAHALTAPELVVLGDAMLRRVGSVTTERRLHEAVARCPPRIRGVRRLREALPLLRAGTDSSMETRTRMILVDAGLACPEVNQDVHDDAGAFLARPDMIYRSQRVAIEYDGDGHRTDKAQWRRDVARRQALEAAGWRVITATADDVLRHPERFVAWVRRALRDQRPIAPAR